MKVAVVILNWNGKSFLEKYLPSVLSGSPEYADIIVADNGSTDESREVVISFQKRPAQDKAPLWIQLDKNWGFTGGYDRAFDIIAKWDVKYDYYILLNSDVMTPKGWIEPLVEFMETHPEVGICQPKILSLREKTHFEYAGACGGFLDRFGFPFCRGRILSSVEEDKGQYETPIKILWASGACMVVRSGLWHRLGGLEEKFFAHMEEIDFCWRAALLDNEVWCFPQSHVYHWGGGTLPNNSPRKLYFNYRNNLLMLRRNLHPKGRGWKIFIRKCIDGLSAMAYLLQGKPGYMMAVIKGHRDYDRMKNEMAVSERSLNYKDCDLTQGIYRHSIILKYFTGHKTFSSLDF